MKWNKVFIIVPCICAILAASALMGFA
jgi:acetoacetate decarboxylase